jgi:hypothetical protein
MGGVLMRGAFALALLLLGGCSHSTFRLRIDEPRGAEMIVEGGAFHDDTRLPVPFVAELTPMNGNAAYPVRFVIPAAESPRFGGRGEVVLYGRLYIYGATELARAQTVRLPVEQDRIRALVTGEVAELTRYVYDPNTASEQRLALLVLRARTF